jgi:aminopeptidase S
VFAAIAVLLLNVDMVGSPNGGYLVQGGEGRDAESAGPPARARSAGSWSTSW